MAFVYFRLFQAAAAIKYGPGMTFIVVNSN